MIFFLSEILKWSDLSHMIPNHPDNEPIKKIAQGFIEAWRLYNVSDAIVLFIVLDWEINIADQRHLEYEIISQESRIKIHRCTLSEVDLYARLDENKTLF
jgi:hypothetical protein